MSGRNLSVLYRAQHGERPLLSAEFHAEAERDGIKRITRRECAAFAELAEALARFEHFIVTWFACGEDVGENAETLLPGINGIGRVETDEPGEPVYYLYCATTTDVTNLLALIWDKFGAITIYPARDFEWGHAYVRGAINDPSDEQRLAMDYGNRRYMKKFQEKQNWGNTLTALAGVFSDVGDFVSKLVFSKGFRRELLDEFRQKSLVMPARDLGAILSKSNYDSYAFLHMMTSHPDALDIIRDVLGRNGVEFDMKQNEKSF